MIIEINMFVNYPVIIVGIYKNIWIIKLLFIFEIVKCFLPHYFSYIEGSEPFSWEILAIKWLGSKLISIFLRSLGP